MARLPFPDDRTVYAPANGIWRTAQAGALVSIYVDSNPGVDPPVPGAAANVLRSDGTAGTIIVDSNSQMASWLGPADGSDTLIVQVTGGPYWRVSARATDRIDALDTRMTAVESAGGGVPTSRTITAGTGLTGGGDFTANRTLAVAYGTSSTTAAVGNDARLSDSRTPTAHKTSHAAGGTDALTPADIGAVPTSRTITAGSGLSGGGDLSANRSLAADVTSVAGRTGAVSLTAADVPWTVVAKTTTYAGAAGEFVLADATSGAFTVTPPTSTNGARFAIKKTDASANAVTIAGTVDGTASPALAYQHGSMELVGDGSAWRRVVRPSLGALVDYPATSDARYGRVAVAGPSPTGVAATDTPALQAAINSVPAGGRLVLPSSSTAYALNAALTVTTTMTIEGDGIAPTFASATSGGSPITPASPYLAGTVIKQTVAATDILQITASGVTVNLRRLGLMFASGLASTGHGINAQPSQTYGSGHDVGLQSFEWDSVYVYGHDGNHYAFVILNPQYGTLIQCHSYGGGGFNIVTDHGAINAGNLVLVHPYSAIINAGTAGGYVHSSVGTTPGTLNLLTYIRPQVICSGPVATAATNPLWDDLAGASAPKGVTAVSADFETAGTNLFRPGSGTKFLAVGLINGANTSNTAAGEGALPTAISPISGSGGTANSAFGNNALAATTTGTNNTAVGGSAMGANTTGGSNTAVGNIALQANTTGSNNTAVGQKALNANLTNGSNTAVGFEALKVGTADNNTAIGAVVLQANTTGNNNTAVGGQALQALTTGSVNTAVGQSAGVSATTGGNNTFLGYKAGVTNTGGNAVTTSSQNTYVGCFAGPSSSSQLNGGTAVGYQATTNGNNATAIGIGASAGASGTVAIGHDSSGGAATTTTQNAFVLGTSLHTVQVSNNTTGAGSAALGANCPAVTATAPYTWFKMLSGDGSAVYVPAWK